MSEVTVVVPVERGTTPRWEIPIGTRYMQVEHDPGERGEAMDAGVAAAETELVVLFLSDGVLEPLSLAMLESCIWDAQAAYPSLVYLDEQDQPSRFGQASPFCPHRLARRNYIGPTCLIRKPAYQKAGGWGQGSWDLWLRLGKLKPVAEARAGIRSIPNEPWQPPPDSEAKATFYSQATIPTTYYRCQLPARVLPGISQPALPPIEEADESYMFTEHEGVAVFQFPGDKMRAVHAATMKGQGIPVFVEVDDTYLHRHGTLERAGWVFKANDPASHHSVEQHRRIVQHADGVICASDYLASQYRKLNTNVHVCPNQLDLADWPTLEKPEDGIIRVGWFASGSHQGDDRLIRSALEWCSKQKGVQVVTMGAGVTNYEMRDEQGNMVEQRKTPWFNFPFAYIPPSNDLAVYWKMLMQLDIGLAPVAPNHWANCRSDLKALEYAAAGVCPVLSANAPYQHWISGEGCLKAGKASEFLRHVKTLVKEPEHRRELVAQARDYVLSKRVIGQNGWLWEQALSSESSKH